MDKFAEAVANKFLTLMSQGVAPWRRTWNNQCALPANFSTGKFYQGMNVWTLMLAGMERGFMSSLWGTYKQLKAAGYQVREKEKGTTIHWFSYSEREQKDGSVKRIRSHKVFTLHNLCQCDVIETGLPWTPSETPEGWSIEKAEGIVSKYLAATNMKVVLGNPAYIPSLDQICMPAKTEFHAPEHYYSTMFHEIAHSTGHGSRLDRDLKPLAQIHSYSVEELIAEFTAGMLCAATGVSNQSTDESSAAYLKHWAAKLGEDPKILQTAIKSAQKAFEFVMGV